MEHHFFPSRFTGSLILPERDPSLPNAVWFEAGAEKDGMVYSFPAGMLANFNYLTADLMLDGDELAVFVLILQEGEGGPAFEFSFGLLNQCSARMRLPLEAVNQNRWRYEREGAWLKPLCGGDRVDLAKVDRMSFSVMRKGPKVVNFCLSPITAVTEEPPLLEQPFLPKGPLLDELGQSAQRDWATKTRSAGRDDCPPACPGRGRRPAAPAGWDVALGRVEFLARRCHRLFPRAARRRPLVAGRPGRIPVLVGRGGLRRRGRRCQHWRAGERADLAARRAR